MEGQRVYALYFKPHGGPEMQYGRQVWTDEANFRTAEAEAFQTAQKLKRAQGRPRIYVGRLDKRDEKRAEQVVRARRQAQGEQLDAAAALVA